MCSLATCFSCFKRLNFEATCKSDGSTLTPDENAARVTYLIELLDTRVNDRVKAPLLFAHNRGYAIIDDTIPITGPESIYTQTYNRKFEAMKKLFGASDDGSAVRLKPLPINAQLKYLVRKYNLTTIINER